MSAVGGQSGFRLPLQVDPSPVDPVDTLAETWEARSRQIRGNELELELWTTGAFLIAAGALALIAHSAGSIDPVAAAVVVGYAIASRVEFPIAAGSFTPNVLLLLPMFVLAPAAYVPLLVFAGFLLAALAAALRGTQALDRVVFAGGDSIHALGPALILVAFAGGDVTGADPPVVAAAFAALFVADFLSASVHELLAIGAVPREHIKTMATIWGVDLALASVGGLAAWQATEAPLAALAPLPLVLLLSRLAEDRARRIDAAHERTAVLELERGRREAAFELLQRQVAFLEEVGHELRMPVKTAQGHIGNARRTGLVGPELDVARSELGRIESMIGRLLMMARADNPETLPTEPLDAAVFLKDRFERWRDAFGRPWLLGDLAEGTISANGEALDAALGALFEHAAKHTSRNHAIELSSSARDGVLLVDVTAGSGLPYATFDRVFERFARNGSGRTERAGSVGLGLALVDAVARAHGGRCAVESSLLGSRFRIRLPGFEPRPEGRGLEPRPQNQSAHAAELVPGRSSG